MGALLFFAGDKLIDTTELDDQALTLAETRLSGPDAEAVCTALCATVAASLAIGGRWKEHFAGQTLQQITDALRVKVNREDPS